MNVKEKCNASVKKMEEKHTEKTLQKYLICKNMSKYITQNKSYDKIQ